jgi:hypothetical protein
MFDRASTVLEVSQVKASWKIDQSCVSVTGLLSIVAEFCGYHNEYI